ncbi:MAG: TlpA disulfide reductase family protein [Bryobacteraceae bacterium]|jgi:peroxiredoxin
MGVYVSDARAATVRAHTEFMSGKISIAFALAGLALPVMLLASGAADDASAVLHGTAAAYEKASSFELTASLTVKVPRQDVLITTAQTAVYAAGAMLPADAPIPVLEIEAVGGSLVYRNSAGQELKPDAGLSLRIESFPFTSLDAIDKRVISARALPDETLRAGGESMLCAVIEALYEKRTLFDGGSGRQVRLWIEKKTSLVRQASYERAWSNGGLAQWTVRVEKMTLDQPPPRWAIEQAASMKGREEAKWIGQPVPDFSMMSLDGQTVKLAALGGKVVLLDFWATWCGPCREEMPLVEKLREELKSRGVEIWGVTDESPDVARRWLAERKRSLPTLVDADRTLFRHYAIENIPVLIVIRGDGKVSNYVVGLRAERELRADIAKAME